MGPYFSDKNVWTSGRQSGDFCSGELGDGPGLISSNPNIFTLKVGPLPPGPPPEPAGPDFPGMCREFGHLGKPPAIFTAVQLFAADWAR